MILNNSEKSKKRVFIIIILLLIAVLAVGGVIIYNSCFANKPTESADGVVGKISSDWDTGIQNSDSGESVGIQIPGYSTAEMNYGDDSLYLSIGNPKTNECGFHATLKLDDGTVLYESELLEPGYGLTDIPVSITLEKGEYTAMVVYQAVTLDDEQSPLNSAESEFTLIIK